MSSEGVHLVGSEIGREIARGSEIGREIARGEMARELRLADGGGGGLRGEALSRAELTRMDFARESARIELARESNASPTMSSLGHAASLLGIRPNITRSAMRPRAGAVF